MPSHRPGARMPQWPVGYYLHREGVPELHPRAVVTPTVVGAGLVMCASAGLLTVVLTGQQQLVADRNTPGEALMTGPAEPSNVARTGNGATTSAPETAAAPAAPPTVLAQSVTGSSGAGGARSEAVAGGRYGRPLETWRSPTAVAPIPLPAPRPAPAAGSPLASGGAVGPVIAAPRSVPALDRGSARSDTGDDLRVALPDRAGRSGADSVGDVSGPTGADSARSDSEDASSTESKRKTSGKADSDEDADKTDADKTDADEKDADEKDADEKDPEKDSDKTTDSDERDSDERDSGKKKDSDEQDSRKEKDSDQRDSDKKDSDKKKSDKKNSDERDSQEKDSHERGSTTGRDSDKERDSDKSESHTKGADRRGPGEKKDADKGSNSDRAHSPRKSTEDSDREDPGTRQLTQDDPGSADRDREAGRRSAAEGVSFEGIGQERAGAIRVAALIDQHRSASPFSWFGEPPAPTLALVRSGAHARPAHAIPAVRSSNLAVPAGPAHYRPAHAIAS